MIKHFEYSRLKKYSLIAMFLFVLLAIWSLRDEPRIFLTNYETKKDYELVKKCRSQKEISIEECYKKELGDR